MGQYTAEARDAVSIHPSTCTHRILWKVEARECGAAEIKDIIQIVLNHILESLPKHLSFNKQIATTEFQIKRSSVGARQWVHEDPSSLPPNPSGSPHPAQSRLLHGGGGSTCSPGASVSCSSPVSPSADTPAYPWCTPACTPQRRLDLCSWREKERNIKNVAFNSGGFESRDTTVKEVP